MFKAYMFPGQGSQYKGMGENLFKLFPEKVKDASDILKYDIKDLCINDPNNKLNFTEYTQPAIYFVSCLAFLQYQIDNESLPDFVCGHSLGEYAALFAAGVFDLFTGLSIVKKRGELMGQMKNGSMMAVISSQAIMVKNILNDIGLDTINIANYNTPEQIVLSGLVDDLAKAKILLENRAFRCVELSVSGAFHSHYMEPIRVAFVKFLVTYDFVLPKIKVISSTTACEIEPSYILEMLGYQLTNSVKWLQTIQHLQKLGVTNFVEIGPGEILTRLNSKIFTLSHPANEST